MAFASLGAPFFGADNSTSSSYGAVTTSTINVGDIIIPQIAIDNIATTTGVTNTVLSVTDSFGNVYVKIDELTISSGVAADGATIAAFWSRCTTQIPSGSTITYNFSASTTNKGILIGWFSVAGGNTVSVVGTVQENTALVSDPASQTISGLTSKEYLFYHCVAWEGSNLDSYTVSTNYGGFGLSVLGNTAVTLLQEARIFTGTGDSVNIASNTSDQDYAQIYFALQEVASGSSLITKKATLRGIERALERGNR